MSRTVPKMRDINDLMPKEPNMIWGALTNFYPTNAKLKQLDKLLPHDKRWHTVFEEKNQVHVDGVTIRRKTAESMT